MNGVTSTTITVSWSLNADLEVQGSQPYELCIKEAGAWVGICKNRSIRTGGTSLTVTGLQPDTLYKIELNADSKTDGWLSRYRWRRIDVLKQKTLPEPRERGGSLRVIDRTTTDLLTEWDHSHAQEFETVQVCYKAKWTLTPLTEACRRPSLSNQLLPPEPGRGLLRVPSTQRQVLLGPPWGLYPCTRYKLIAFGFDGNGGPGEEIARGQSSTLGLCFPTWWPFRVLVDAGPLIDDYAEQLDRSFGETSLYRQIDDRFGSNLGAVVEALSEDDGDPDEDLTRTSVLLEYLIEADPELFDRWQALDPVLAERDLTLHAFVEREDPELARELFEDGESGGEDGSARGGFGDGRFSLGLEVEADRLEDDELVPVEETLFLDRNGNGRLDDGELRDRGLRTAEAQLEMELATVVARWRPGSWTLGSVQLEPQLSGRLGLGRSEDRVLLEDRSGRAWGLGAELGVRPCGSCPWTVRGGFDHLDLAQEDRGSGSELGETRVDLERQRAFVTVGQDRGRMAWNLGVQRSWYDQEGTQISGVGSEVLTRTVRDLTSERDGLVAGFELRPAERWSLHARGLLSDDGWSAGLGVAFGLGSRSVGRREPGPGSRDLEPATTDLGVLHNAGTRWVLERLELPDPEPSPEAVEAEAERLAARYVERFHGELSDRPIPLEPATEARIDEIYRIIEQDPPLGEYLADLGELEARAVRELEGDQRVVLQGAVDIARSSGLFWRSSAEGGLGGSRYLLDPPVEEGPPPIFKKLWGKVKDAFRNVDWSKVVGADVAGGVKGLVTGGPQGGLTGAIGGSAGSFAGQMVVELLK